MKSVIQAVWLLTTAGGDLIDLIIAELNLFTNLVSFISGVTRGGGGRGAAGGWGSAPNPVGAPP